MKKPTEPFRIDDSRMPVRLGSALKVPSYAYANWGIPEGQYRCQSDELYSAEWEGGSPNQMQVVIDSITRTGLGNYSQKLRDGAAEAVLRYVSSHDGRVTIVEPGAGVSTVCTCKRLDEAGIDLDRLHITMIEPSMDRLESAAAGLEEMGLKRGGAKHFETYATRDVHAVNVTGEGTQNLVVSVAQIHHHAYLDTPLKSLHAALRPGGYTIITDWHNSMWEHPARVYQYLQEFEWETKDEDMASFTEMFPKALDDAPELDNPLDEASNDHIRSFWRDGYAVVRAEAIGRSEFSPDDDILMLEGHRHVERYFEDLRKVGYRIEADGLIDENPNQLLPDSRILMATVAKKAA